MSTKTRAGRRWLAATAVGVLGASLLAGCSADGRETIRFTFSKREALSFMNDVVAQYNASQDEVRVEMDSSGVDVVSASFVRGNPPDIMLANYNYEVARFVQRCALSDLSGTAAAASVREDLQPLMDQYGSCAGRTSALPYSVMAASVIYNTQIFDQLGLQVPTTYDELIQVAETLKQNGVTPFYGTFKDDWTVAQGWYDYSVGGSLDVIDFFDGLAGEGAEVGPDSPSRSPRTSPSPWTACSSWRRTTRIRMPRAGPTATATSPSPRARRACTCRDRGRSARSPRRRPTCPSGRSRCP